MKLTDARLYSLGAKLMETAKWLRCSFFHWHLTGTGRVIKVGYAEHLEECPRCGVVWGPMT